MSWRGWMSLALAAVLIVMFATGGEGPSLDHNKGNGGLADTFSFLTR